MEYEKKVELFCHYYEIGKYDKALELINSLIESNVEFGNFYYLRAVCLKGLGRKEEAIEDVKYALEKGYSEEDCFEFIGSAYLEWGMYREAQEYFNEVLRLNPRNAYALAMYASVIYDNSYDREGRLKADNYMKMALEIDHNNPRIIKKAFYYYVDRDMSKEAKANLDRYLQVSSSEESKLVILANYERYMYNYRKSSKLYKQAFTINPENGWLPELIKNDRFRFVILKHLHIWKRETIRKIRDKYSNKVVGEVLCFLVEGITYAIRAFSVFVFFMILTIIRRIIGTL